MSGANYYDLHSHSKRISYFPDGRGPIGGAYKGGPLLIYDDGSSHVECSGEDLKVGPSTWAGTTVVALIRKNGIVPGAVTSLLVQIPDVSPSPVDAAVPMHTIAIQANHRGTPVIGPGQLETYAEMAFHGTAALVKLPL